MRNGGNGMGIRREPDGPLSGAKMGAIRHPWAHGKPGGASSPGQERFQRRHGRLPKRLGQPSGQPLGEQDAWEPDLES